eukprot:38049_1
MNIDWGLYLIKLLIYMNKYPVLSNIILDIVNVRKGSIIIEYSLTGYNQELFNRALTNMNETIQIGYITVYNITYFILSNTELLCNYYDFGSDDTYYRFDSYDEIYNVSIVQQMDNILTSKFATNKSLVVKHTENAAGIVVNCVGNVVESQTASICVIQCDKETWCRNTKVIPASGKIRELIIICTGKSSCDGMQINLMNTKIKILSVFCYSKASCDSVNVDIMSQLDMDIQFYCDDNENENGLVCRGMNINLYNNNNAADNNIYNTITNTIIPTTTTTNNNNNISIPPQPNQSPLSIANESQSSLQ